MVRLFMDFFVVYHIEYGFVDANVSKIIHILLQKHIGLAINCLISMEVSCSITY